MLPQDILGLAARYENDKEYPVDRKNDQASAPQKLGSIEYSGEVTDMVHDGRSESKIIDDRDLLAKQALKYADDLATLFEIEKVRAKALHEANEKLKREITVRRRTEKELLSAKQELERRVEERTKDLSSANERLQSEVNQRKRAEKQLLDSLKEKETLIFEVHHRVKNNLQIVSSLLNLQCNGIADDKVLQALRDSRSRIVSMALIHEQLYGSKNLAAIDFERYLNNLAKTLLDGYCRRPYPVSVKTEVDNVVLPVDTALPCSLIINELLTNSLKHAFPENRRGEILIEFKSLPLNGYSLTVKDDGTGFPEDVNFETSKSLGLQLVRNLTQLQLQGSLSIECNNGTSVKIEFEKQLDI